ncbi:hypothetical protein [Gemmatimonas sp.]|jgi:hypothetical protein|uniref:hypothetical protein n=1 Tax=Gemmatimonas sp. TaxID=1962908 RepID=UPI0022C009B9|nr:hypothetical protein [Gemmatimonas sp.]MCZ8206205.1 hypothetical protein [Gemmatimonas sp.]
MTIPPANGRTMLTRAEISRWINHNRFLVVLILVVLAGYTLGKDRALRDNAREVSSLAQAGTR